MRPTSEQIDHGILETAAGIFAQHGYHNTSLQQIADAVGYSKAGVLHRFGSKEALFRAVVSYGTELFDQVLVLMADVPSGPHRTRELLQLSADFAMDHPGMLRISLEIIQPNVDFPDTEDVILLALKLVSAFDVPLGEPAQNLRLALALQLLSNAVLAGSLNSPLPLGLPRHQLVPYAADLALAVLDSPATVAS